MDSLARKLFEGVGWLRMEGSVQTAQRRSRRCRPYICVRSATRYPCPSVRETRCKSRIPESTDRHVEPEVMGGGELHEEATHAEEGPPDRKPGPV